jgi:hypothetical protein
MNFTKILLIVVPIGLLFGGWLYMHHVDRSDPVAVATAFTKAMKNNDLVTASSYYVPERAEAWRSSTDDALSRLKSGPSRIFFDGIPGSPVFVTVAPKAGKAVNPDQMSLQSSEGYALDMTRSTGKWYVSRSPQ